ncbi:MAG: PASTA domain-containing protein [Erysipelotrichaceae bacterium]|nr:PASTA domain-containing protein [Erysipelotrichaceae bacterium]
MAEKKDYLSQLASEIEGKKPESFKEEKLEKIERPQINLNPKAIGAAAAVLVLILGVVWFVLFRAKIEMPDFVGQTQADVTAWIRQQGIKSSGIIMKEEYSFEYDEDVILSQSVEPGKKVKEDAKLTFVVSLGADPDELVEFPEDVLSMTKEDINDWIDENKLEKVRISQAYSDEVEEGYVISFDLKGIDKEEFTRSTNVTFTVSRGPQPAQSVRVDNFVDKSQYEVEAWAKSNNITLEIYESYSEDKAEGVVLSQSVASGKTMKEGDVLIVTVSKGKAVIVPDFTKMTEAEFAEWTSENPGLIKMKERYSESENYILSQSVRAGASLGKDDDKLEVVINLGMPELPGGLGIGSNYQALVDWCNAERSKGSDMFTAQWTSEESTYSYMYPQGTIISMNCYSHSTGTVAACSGPLPLDARFDVVISKGLVVDLNELPENTARLADMMTSLGFNYIIETSAETANLYDQNNPDVKLTVGDKIYEDHQYIIK